MSTRVRKLRNHSTAGAALVEVIIGLFLVLIVVGMISGAITNYTEARARLFDEAQKSYLAEEAYEALRFLRDEDWTNVGSLSLEARYALQFAPGAISTTAGVESVQGFERSFVLSEVYRSTEGTIVPVGTPGATLDPDARTATIDVVSARGTTTVTALLTNFLTP